MSSEQRQWTGSVTTRMRCCICGGDTEGADDYIVVALSAAASTATQYLGAHAAHLEGVMARGFSVEVTLM